MPNESSDYGLRGEERRVLQLRGKRRKLRTRSDLLYHAREATDDRRIFPHNHDQHGTAVNHTRVKSGRCPHDQAPLAGDGYCQRGQGYPLTVACPFACPYCRQPLEWSGACLHCHGSATPLLRDSWSYPGDRWETHDPDDRPIGDGQHWQRVATGPRPVYRPSPEESAILQRVLTRLAQSPDLVPNAAH